MSVASAPPLVPGARFELNTLGRASLLIVRPGQPPELALEAGKAGKPLAFLIYLAFSPDRTERREVLIDLLWDNLDKEDARRHALSQTIWHCKKKLGDGALGTPNDRVTLLTTTTSDRDAVLAAWQERDAETVVRLYAGDFLPAFAVPGGSAFEEWARLERTRLRTIFVRAGEIVVRDRLSHARHGEAREIARRVRDVDPLDQTGWRLLLETAIASNDPLGTAVEADALERHLAAEGLEVEPATRALLRMARGATKASAERAAGRSADTTEPALRVDLVGRDREFSAILQAWEHARTGRAAFVHVTAPPGLGKTRLLDDIGARLRVSRARVVQVRAEFGTRDIAYALASDLAAALADRPGARGVSPQAASALVALNPTLSSTYPVAPDPATGDEALRRRALALRELITALTDEQPVALLLDDLHWSDALSLRLLDAALTGLGRAGVLVVTAERPLGGEPRHASGGTRIDLEPLRAEDVAALISSVAWLPVEPWAEQLPAALREATGGSPLLVLETLQLLGERWLLVRSSGGKDENGHPVFSWQAGDPASLFAALGEGSALRRRVEGLAPVERSILLALATAGVPLSTSRLRAAVGFKMADLDAPVAILEQRGLVVRRGDEWATAHDEHAASVVAAATEDEVRTTAAAVGRAIADDAHGNGRELRLAAFLLVTGGDLETAARIFERCVRDARLAGDQRADRLLARDLLGRAATRELETRLVRSLPWFVRARLLSAPRIAAAAATITVISVALGGSLAWIYARPTPEPDAVLVAERLSADRSAFELFDIPLDTDRWAGVGLLDVELSGKPRWRIRATGAGDRNPRPDGRGWTGSRVMSDSGVLDVVDVALDGTERRLTFTAGDDYQPAWAPDNSRFVFITMRWHPRARYDLAVYDTLTRSVRQLTQGDDTDWQPRWSPDGSRIAFVRQEWATGEYRLCVMDADGQHLRCLPSESGADVRLQGWGDARHVLIWRAAGDTRQLVRLDPAAGTEEILDPDTPQEPGLSPDGQWVVCTCARRGYPAGAWIVYPLERPDQFKLLRPANVDARLAGFSWAPTSRRLPFLEQLRIAAGLGPPVLGATHQMRSSGIGSSGGAMTPGIVRWRSLDTSVATIDSTGLLTPRQAGRVTIEASAGGWRRATTDLTIRAREEQLLLDERWVNGFAPVWVPFGAPRPEIVPSEHFGRAFLNNGDQAFWSGAYTAESFTTRKGLWVEMELSSPINASEWQHHAVRLVTFQDSVAWAGWDHVTGDGPSGASLSRCSIGYPGGVGGARWGEQLRVESPLDALAVAAPKESRTGRPFRALVQVFPDGRCGFAIDGRPVWVSPPAYLYPAARVMLAGNSVGTRMTVGRVRVSSGVAAHVSWDGQPARDSTRAMR